MPIKSTYKITNADEVEATITITALVRDFRKMLEFIEEGDKIHHWPLSEITHQMFSLIEKAEETYQEIEEDKIP